MTTATASQWQTTAGNMNNLRLVEGVDIGPLPTLVPSATVAVKFVGLNFADMFACLGLYSATPKGTFVPGLEFSGVIEAVNSLAAESAEEGGSEAEFLGDSTGRGFKIALPAQALTAWYGLVELGAIGSGLAHWRVSALDKIKGRKRKAALIHSGAGGTGLWCVHICRYFNVDVTATVGSADKKKLLEDMFQEPSVAADGSPSTSRLIVIDRLAHDRSDADRRKALAQSLCELHHHHNPAHASLPESEHPKLGFDYVFDSLLGPWFQPSFDAMRAQGRHIVLGAGSMTPPGSKVNWLSLGYKYCTRSTIDPLSMMSENKSVMAFNLIWLFENVDEVGEYLQGLVAMIQSAKGKASSGSGSTALLPTVGHLYDDFAQLPDALKKFQSGTTIGKVVVSTRTGEYYTMQIRDDNMNWLRIGFREGLMTPMCGSGHNSAATTSPALAYQIALVMGVATRMWVLSLERPIYKSALATIRTRVMRKRSKATKESINNRSSVWRGCFLWCAYYCGPEDFSVGSQPGESGSRAASPLPTYPTDVGMSSTATSLAGQTPAGSPGPAYAGSSPLRSEVDSSSASSLFSSLTLIIPRLILRPIASSMFVILAELQWQPGLVDIIRRNLMLGVGSLMTDLLQLPLAAEILRPCRPVARQGGSAVRQTSTSELLFALSTSSGAVNSKTKKEATPSAASDAEMIHTIVATAPFAVFVAVRTVCLMAGTNNPWTVLSRRGLFVARVGGSGARTRSARRGTSAVTDSSLQQGVSFTHNNTSIANRRSTIISPLDGESPLSLTETETGGHRQYRERMRLAERLRHLSTLETVSVLRRWVASPISPKTIRILELIMTGLTHPIGHLAILHLVAASELNGETRFNYSNAARGKYVHPTLWQTIYRSTALFAVSASLRTYAIPSIEQHFKVAVHGMLVWVESVLIHRYEDAIRQLRWQGLLDDYSAFPSPLDSQQRIINIDRRGGASASASGRTNSVFVSPLASSTTDFISEYNATTLIERVAAKKDSIIDERGQISERIGRLQQRLDTYKGLCNSVLGIGVRELLLREAGNLRMHFGNDIDNEDAAAEEEELPCCLVSTDGNDLGLLSTTQKLEEGDIPLAPAPFSPYIPKPGAFPQYSNTVANDSTFLADVSHITKMSEVGDVSRLDYINGASPRSDVPPPPTSRAPAHYYSHRSQHTQSADPHNPSDDQPYGSHMYRSVTRSPDAQNRQMLMSTDRPPSVHAPPPPLSTQLLPRHNQRSVRRSNSANSTSASAIDARGPTPPPPLSHAASQTSLRNRTRSNVSVSGGARSDITNRSSRSVNNQSTNGRSAIKTFLPVNCGASRRLSVQGQQPANSGSSRQRRVLLAAETASEAAPRNSRRGSLSHVDVVQPAASHLGGRNRSVIFDETSISQRPSPTESSALESAQNRRRRRSANVSQETNIKQRWALGKAIRTICTSLWFAAKVVLTPPFCHAEDPSLFESIVVVILCTHNSHRDSFAAMIDTPLIIARMKYAASAHLKSRAGEVGLYRKSSEEALGDEAGQPNDRLTMPRNNGGANLQNARNGISLALLFEDEASMGFHILTRRSMPTIPIFTSQNAEASTQQVNGPTLSLARWLFKTGAGVQPMVDAPTPSSPKAASLKVVFTMSSQNIQHISRFPNHFLAAAGEEDVSTLISCVPMSAEEDEGEESDHQLIQKLTCIDYGKRTSVAVSSETAATLSPMTTARTAADTLTISPHTAVSTAPAQMGGLELETEAEYGEADPQILNGTMSPRLPQLFTPRGQEEEDEEEGLLPATAPRRSINSAITQLQLHETAIPGVEVDATRRKDLSVIICRLQALIERLQEDQTALDSRIAFYTAVSQGLSKRLIVRAIWFQALALIISSVLVRFPLETLAMLIDCRAAHHLLLHNGYASLPTPELTGSSGAASSIFDFIGNEVSILLSVLRAQEQVPARLPAFLRGSVWGGVYLEARNLYSLLSPLYTGLLPSIFINSSYRLLGTWEDTRG